MEVTFALFFYSERANLFGPGTSIPSPCSPRQRKPSVLASSNA